MAHLKLCPHRLAQLTSCSAIPSSAAHLKLCYTLSIAAQLMLCYAIWDSSHQALLHLWNTVLCSSSAAHLKLCYTPSRASHLKLSSAAHLKLCYTV